MSIFLREKILRKFMLVLLISVIPFFSGCTVLFSSVVSDFSDNLMAAVQNQYDPEVVRDGAPAYMLLLDSFIEGNPNNPVLLSVAASIYASYGSVFSSDVERASRLTQRALEYGNKALCISYTPSCNWQGMDYMDYEATLTDLKAKHSRMIFAYGVASLAYVRAHSSDWNAIAQLPYIEALLKKYIEIGGEDIDTIYTYLGILVTLRPPALGGEQEKGKQYFESAIKISSGKNLSAKVEYARGYARPLYDRKLHDRLLNDVVSANPRVLGYTLTNVLAQREAKELLSSADDYF
tara:strand:+ start:57 stop:935 length:879 start_codon:yes stop_codon:yes gene_type:complete